MAITIYRSKVAITTAALRRAAYSKLADLCTHLQAFNVNLLRVELMPDNFVEVELNNPLPNAEQIDHLGLQEA